MVPPIGMAPTVSISSPVDLAKLAIPNGGPPIQIAVSAGSPVGLINKVELYIDGFLFGTATTFPYSFNWTPTVVGTYRLIALAYDDKENVVSSSGTGGPTLITIAASPTVSIMAPAPNQALAVNTPVVLTAAATDSNIGGSITQVAFFVDDKFVGNATTIKGNQYSFTWTPTAIGTVQITARATNAVPLSTMSAAVSATVANGGPGGDPTGDPPTVSVTSPVTGSVVRVGLQQSLAASASDPDGTIASVQFTVNGVALGGPVTTLSGSPLAYRTNWTPTAEGVHRITATAVDNAGNSKRSTEVAVMVVLSASGADTVDTGLISGIVGTALESGRYSAIHMGGKTAAFIGTSTLNGANKTYFFSSLPLGLGGDFSGSAGGHTIAGQFSETGSFGTLDGNVTFSGIIATTTAPVAKGYYAGNITGRSASTVNAIVAPDGVIAIYILDGSFQGAGFGSVDAAGGFKNILLNSGGATISGKADPATGFLSATLTGGPGGTIMAATTSGNSLSDGSLRNLSTRGQVGTGGNVLIAGFYVGGSTPKQVPIRAIGPTLANYGITGALADPQLQIYDSQSSPIIGLSNNNWANNPAIVAASGAVGAFPLPANSLDAALLTTLVPGVYSVQVSGVNNGTGLALVELYDVDNLAAFSSQRVLNISTRGNVGVNTNQLIAGFVVSGNAPKKVLIRGVSPTLASYGVAGSLADPVLTLQQIVNNAAVTVRENDNWETGNDATLVSDAAVKVGAFPLTAGSKDAVILLNLPSGTYSAQLRGISGTTGVGLVEVYEVQ